MDKRLKLNLRVKELESELANYELDLERAIHERRVATNHVRLLLCKQKEILSEIDELMNKKRGLK